MAKKASSNPKKSATGAVGPKLLELEKVAAQSNKLESKAIIEMPDFQVELGVERRKAFGGEISTSESIGNMSTIGHAPQLASGMVDLARKWTSGKLRLESITVKCTKGPMKAADLQRLAVEAWCEACGVDFGASGDMTIQLAVGQSRQDDLRTRLLTDLRGAAAGVKRWNALAIEERLRAGHFRKADLAQADLTNADLSSDFNHTLDFQGANLDGAILKEAKLESNDFRKATFRNANLDGASCGIVKFNGADFAGASLAKAMLRVSIFTGAAFPGARLTGADLCYADLRGADLSGADLAGVQLDNTKFNEKTLFPPGFVPPESMDWKGAGRHPGLIRPTLPAVKAGSMGFDAFYQTLSSKIEAAKLSKAASMLKAESFQLFAEVKPDSLVGVVKSQTSDELVYSCRLGSNGSFSCCTQNLRPCGGLQGSLCKHLLVLIVGLAKAGQLDPATVNGWIDASQSEKPFIDKDVMTETFLRYKGAEAGTIDWRPTETVPEDYYAL